MVLAASGLLDLGLDDNQRIRFAFNIVPTKEGSGDLEAETKAVLVSGGMTADDIYLTSKAVLPDGSGPYLSVTATPGFPAQRIHNLRTGPKYFKPGAFVMAVGQDTVATKARAWQALGLLTAVKNQTVVA